MKIKVSFLAMLLIFGLWMSQSTFAQFKGENRLVISHPDDIFWDDQFGPTALGGGGSTTVLSSAVDGNNVYFGGEFLYAGEKTVNHIVRWDGTNWNELGTGTNGTIYSICVHNGVVYAGGRFDSAGGAPASCIARWDGTQWQPLGTGMSGSGWMTIVYSLAWSDNYLYAGGDFTQAGGVTAKYIARWDGTQWSEVAGGTDDPVRALFADGSDLYAGGDFHWAGPYPGGQFVYHIARFDGSQWYPLGTGMDKEVYCLGKNSSGLFAGGKFTTAGGVSAKYIARWDGDAWNLVENSIMPQTGDCPVNSFAFNGNDLYVGGNFNISGIGPYDFQNFAKWDGTTWSGCGYGFLGYQIYTAVYTVCAKGTSIYAGGYFTSNSSVYMHNLGCWDGAEWHPVGTGFGNGTDSNVNALIIWNNKLWAGGRFERGGDTKVNYVGAWDGTGWTEPGGGTGFEVMDLMPLGTDLYVGGAFTTVGNLQPAGGIARWDGSAWHPLGNGFTSTVYAIAHIGSDIYIGRSLGYVNKWNGSQWTLIGEMGGTSEGVKNLAVIGTDLFAGGTFTDAAGVPANYMAKWNGSQWSALGSGTNGIVLALCSVGNDLYAGGCFTTAGSQEAKGLARWDGSQWYPVGGGVEGCVSALAYIDGALYVGGSFTTAGEIPANNLAKWDGSQWTAFGSGTIDDVRAIAKFGDNLYAGGYFEAAGGKSSAFIGSWLKWPVGDHGVPGELQQEWKVIPNPAADKCKIQRLKGTEGVCEVNIFDLFGRNVMNVYKGRINSEEIGFDVSNLTAGVYFVTVNAGGSVSTMKLLKMNKK